MTWAAVEVALDAADSIAWDGCHKIYIMLDKEQTAKQISYGYRENDGSWMCSWLFLSSEKSKAEMLALLREWWASSCGLRFISSVRTNLIDPNAGFTQLFAQFEDVNS